MIYQYIPIPMQFVGPIKIQSTELEGEFKVPMATFETPLWLSCNRGAKVSFVNRQGINAVIVKDNMSRSVILKTLSTDAAKNIVDDLNLRLEEIKSLVAKTSRFAILQEISSQIVGNLIYLRISIFSQDAAGHNMVTLAAQEILNWILKEYPKVTYKSISGNYCTDKKVSAVNGILGRGKYIVAEINIDRNVVDNILKTTPEKIVDINIKKNLLGSILAGSLRSANAHFANMLLATYLATGQDAANIVEGSQGITHAEVIDDSLYFSVTLPNIIVGTIGNGKHLPCVQENLKSIGCSNLNARQLAIIIAATVLCGELSLLAAQTNNGELISSHISLERQK